MADCESFESKLPAADASAPPGLGAPAPDAPDALDLPPPDEYMGALDPPLDALDALDALDLPPPDEYMRLRPAAAHCGSDGHMETFGLGPPPGERLSPGRAPTTETAEPRSLASRARFARRR